MGGSLQGGGDLTIGGDFTPRVAGFFSGAGVPSGEGDLLPAIEASGDFPAGVGPSRRDV